MENLTLKEQNDITGGGPIVDGLSWALKTIGSFAHGFVDGFIGNDPCV